MEKKIEINSMTVIDNDLFGINIFDYDPNLQMFVISEDTKIVAISMSIDSANIFSEQFERKVTITESAFDWHLYFDAKNNTRFKIKDGKVILSELVYYKIGQNLPTGDYMRQDFEWNLGPFRTREEAEWARCTLGYRQVPGVIESQQFEPNFEKPEYGRSTNPIIA